MKLKEIIDLAKGDRSSLSQKALYNWFDDYCFTICRRYMKTEQEAEERMQDGFVIFFRKLKSFNYKSDDETKMYIGRIMVTVCTNYLRRNKPMYIVSGLDEDDAVLDERKMSSLSESEIHTLICSLPVGARAVFNLAAVEGYSLHETAKLLGISLSTSKSQLVRAKSLLQNKLSLVNRDHEEQQSNR